MVLLKLLQNIGILEVSKVNKQGWYEGGVRGWIGRVVFKLHI